MLTPSAGKPSEKRTVPLTTPTVDDEANWEDTGVAPAPARFPIGLTSGCGALVSPLAPPFGIVGPGIACIPQESGPRGEAITGGTGGAPPAPGRFNSAPVPSSHMP